MFVIPVLFFSIFFYFCKSSTEATVLLLNELKYQICAVNEVGVR